MVLNPGSEECLEVMTKAPVGNSGGKIPSPDLSRRSPKDEAGRGDIYIARGVNPGYRVNPINKPLKGAADT